MLKSVLNKCCTPAEKPYPKIRIGVNTDIIVLFTSAKVGTVLNKGNNNAWNIGDHSMTWSEKSFEDYQGTVTLEN